MLGYNRENWLRLTFSWRGSILAHIWPRLALIAGLASVIALAPSYGIVIPQLDSLGHSLVGLSLGLLIVFRNNASYDRYWEGRKAWEGIAAAVRSLSRAAAAYSSEPHRLTRLIVAYTVALRASLRGRPALDDLRAMLPAELATRAATLPLPAILFELSAEIRRQNEDGRLRPEPVGMMEFLINDLTRQQSACERIRNTPIPLCHAAHINQLLSVYLLTLPLVLVPAAGWMGVLMVTVVAFGLIGIDEAGVEIEQPFGTDLNDLPLDDLCAELEREGHYLTALGTHAGRQSALRTIERGAPLSEALTR